MLEAYYGVLTSMDYATDGGASQLAICVRALEVFPLDAQLLCAMGGYLHRLGRAELSLQSYRTAYRFGQVQPLVWHIAEIRDVAAICCSVAMQLQQQNDEAVQFLEAALREREDSLRMRRRLVEMYVARGDRESALSHVGKWTQQLPRQEALRSAVRGACYAAQQNWIAARAYLNAAYGHGCRDPLCFKWLAATLIACGDRQGARPILEQWSAAEPRNSEPRKMLASLAPAAIAAAASDNRTIRVDSPVAANPLATHPFHANPIPGLFPGADASR
jgi:tetratricopeptide (TPR) repeat protein